MTYTRAEISAALLPALFIYACFAILPFLACLGA